MARYRSRLVCMEVRRGEVEAIFSATPPLEAARVLVAIAASEDPRRVQDPYKVMVLDVSRAHFYAKAVRDVYVRLPPEEPRSSDPNACGKLRCTMYGTLDAAEQWGYHYTAVLLAAGFVQGVASPCHFYHPTKGAFVVVHGDDFMVVGKAAARRYTQEVLTKEYEMSSIKTLGLDNGDEQNIKYLNRTLTITPHGIEWEADETHVQKILEALGLEQAKGAASPCIPAATEAISARQL